MKKKLFCIMLSALLLFYLSGCDKKETESKKIVSIECSLVDEMYGGSYGDKLTAVSYIKAKYNESGYLDSSEYTTVETSGTDEIYAERKKEFTPSEGNTLDGDIKFDDVKRTVTMTSTSKTDYSLYTEEQKKELFVTNSIKGIEERGYKCEIKGATREELGL